MRSITLISLALLVALVACMPQAVLANDNRGNGRNNYQPQGRGRQVNVRRANTGAVIGAFILGTILNRVLNQSARPQGQPVYVPQQYPTVYPTQPQYPVYKQPVQAIDAVVGPVQLRFRIMDFELCKPKFVTIPDSQPVYAGCQIWFIKDGNQVVSKFDVIDVCKNIVTLRTTWGGAPDDNVGFGIVYPNQ